MPLEQVNFGAHKATPRCANSRGHGNGNEVPMHEQPIPKLCQCGCGQPAPIATKTELARGYVRGEPRRFVHGHAAPKSIEDALWSRLRVADDLSENGWPDCWVWTGGLSNGYGRVKNKGAHVVAYEEVVGLVPRGLYLDHLCRRRSCCNPAHLEPVTHAENVRRGVNYNSAKTHCKRGHPLSGENVKVESSGSRRCRTCKRLGSRRDEQTRKTRKAERQWSLIAAVAQSALEAGLVEESRRPLNGRWEP